MSFAHTLGRIILGIIFIVHGWQKVFGGIGDKFSTAISANIDGVAAGFSGMGVPAPELSAWVVSFAELGGGVLLVLGLAVPLVALVLIIDMLFAIFIAHIDAGFFAAQGGYEFPLALIAGLLAVSVPQGSLGVDGAFMRRRAARRNAVVD